VQLDSLYAKKTGRYVISTYHICSIEMLRKKENANVCTLALINY
jgi:hypothetical protein